LKRIYSLIFLVILVIAPLLSVMVSTLSVDSTKLLDDTSEAIFDGDLTESVLDDGATLTEMHFTETSDSANGMYYICRRGIDTVAYFGVSMVKLLSGGTEFTLEFPGSKTVIPQGEKPTGSLTNYFYGNDVSKWRTGLQDYALLRYDEIYPGIDLVYKVCDGNLKYEFAVSPYADPGNIRIYYTDARFVEVSDDCLTVEKDGFRIDDGNLRVFQDTMCSDVGCMYSKNSDGTISFTLDEYDTSKTLVIDPLLVAYSTFLGGIEIDSIESLAVEDGYIYVAGDTNSPDFPLESPYDSTFNGTKDVFVAKLGKDGQTLIYCTFIGGTDVDYNHDLAVENGFVYICGNTHSDDFPLVKEIDNTLNGTNDGYVLKLNTNFQSIEYSTYIGGIGLDYSESIVVEDSYVYISGQSHDTGYPTVNAYDSTHSGLADAVVTKFDQDGQSLIFSTYLGSTGSDYGKALAVDEDGSVYVTGKTSSSGFPTALAYQPSLSGTSDMFLTKFSPSGTTLDFSTFFGGGGGEEAWDMVLGDESVFIVGQTSSSNFPTENPFDATYGGSTDCALVKFTSDGMTLMYSTYLGGSSTDVGTSISLESGSAVITGYTSSEGFPTIDSYLPNHAGSSDCFITKFSYDGGSLIYSTFHGGSEYDRANAIQVINGTAFVGGYTESPNFPMKDAQNSTLGGGSDGFVSVLSPDSDSDSLTDWYELLIGTNQYSIDSDNDNFLDGYEHAYGSDPIDPLDYPAMPQEWYDEIYEDLDGNEAQIMVLTALVSENTEFLNSLNASLYFLNETYLDDYDDVQDALDEIRDVLEGLGLSVGDSDYDGLDDLDEIAIGTDLLCIDSDTDNLNDAFEVKLGTDPLDDDSDADTYLDGIEYIAGTDPLDPLSYPGATQGIDPMLIYIAIGGGAVLIIVLVIGVKKRRG
jgi:hypothetical protein